MTVLRGDDRGMLSGVNGVLLSGKTEGVPPHRVKNIEPLHALVSGVDIGGGVAEWVANMETRPRWIREHVEDVDLLLPRLACLEGSVLRPI